MSQHRVLLLCACLLWFLGGVAAAAELSADEQLLRDNKLPSDGPGLLEFFRNRTIDKTDEAKIKALIRQLGDDDFNKREEASQRLVSIGARAKPLLKQAATDPDVEIVRRAEECLQKIEQGATAAALSAGVRVLALRKPAGGTGVLLGYLPSAEDDSVAEEIRTALVSLAVHDGKPDPMLMAALSDKLAVKRAAAGAALGRSGLPEPRDAVRKLLADADPTVRLRVGLALAATREKESLPVLIDLLADPALPAQELWPLEELLYRLAEDKAPTVAPGGDAASRRKFRDAWLAWWKDNGPGLDAARLEQATKTLGNTLVLLLDKGAAIDLDNNNKPRWQIEGLEFPLDAQLLPGDKLLAAEHNGGKVTVRKPGAKEPEWEYKADSPLAAQRMPNGNTLIATRTTLVELAPDGKTQVFTYTPPGGEHIMRAQKLPSGDYALVVQLGVTRFQLIDKNGKEIRSFGVDVRTSGGRIQVLPNGHVIVPENGNNRVVEHDTRGQIVWEVAVEQPIAATRLANGHTLVTSMNPLVGAVELDRAGKQIWQYKSETRVTRAYRR